VTAPDFNSQGPPPTIGQPWIDALRAMFAYDKLRVSQKILAIAQKYYVSDEFGRPRFYVVRPPKLAANLALGLIALAARLLLLFTAYRLLVGGQNIVAAALLLIGGNFVITLAHVLLSPYRHIEVYSNEDMAWRILTITQDNKLGLWRHYTLYDCLGNEACRMRRDTLRSIFRREWIVETPTGDLIFVAREDSLVRALLRRYLGPLYGVLRTNFNFEFADGTVFGKYDRQLTITDEYVLDLGGDPARTVDRRATLAMAILLDTGEAR